MRLALLIGGKDAHTVPTAAQLDGLDDARRLVRVWYYYAGPAPTERWQADGVDIVPVFAKHRSVRFLGATMMFQRIAWLPSTRPLALELDGARIPLRLGGPHSELTDLADPVQLRARLGRPQPPSPLRSPTTRQPFWTPGVRTPVQLARLAGRVRPAARRRAGIAEAKLLQAAARAPRIRDQFADAWLLMDRDSQAQDNAERFYEYLREHQPGVNAWFVLSRTSADWDRLRRKGFRLIAYGSRRHTVALLNCRHLISSQIDQYVVHPLPRPRYPENWYYTFLQHGVTKDDLSVWINRKPIDLMLTVTPDEHAAIVGEHTPYRYTEREIAMTGFPRHDRLLELARHTPPDDQRLILVSPTWRRELLLDLVAGGNDRALRADFWDTGYATQWRSFVESELLHKAADEYGWQIMFVPHPNMQDYLVNSPLPSHIKVHRFQDVDIQELLARTGLLVTDYSSMAFETGFLQRPVVYFQFDRAEFFDGTHAYRQGTWSYADSGFGPVTERGEDAVQEVISIIARGGRPDPRYAERMESAFPLRDGQSSRRTYEAIRAIETPLPDSVLYRPVERP
jgi:CDP-glycerol glycerophosphotransferase (TagB/SpsB family)